MFTMVNKFHSDAIKIRFKKCGACGNAKLHLNRNAYIKFALTFYTLVSFDTNHWIFIIYVKRKICIFKSLYLINYFFAITYDRVIRNHVKKIPCYSKVHRSRSNRISARLKNRNRKLFRRPSHSVNSSRNSISETNYSITRQV